jgi:hypothetical protein
VASGSRWNRSRTRPARSSVSGRVTGSGAAPRSTGSDSADRSSSSANGLPPVAWTRRAVTSGGAGAPSGSPSRAAAEAGSRPGSRCSGSPPPANRRPSPSRAPNSTAIRSARRRRAANTRASAEATSSQCASSTRQSTGRSSAASASRPSTPTETRKRSTGPPRAIPRALRSSSACGGGRPGRWVSTPRSSWCSPAKASSDSDSTPCAHSTVMSAARCRAAPSSADFPIPAVPRRTSARPAEPRASSSNRSIRASSTALPASTAPR